MELSRGVGEVWYAGGSSHGVDGLRLFACGADLPRVYLQRRRRRPTKQSATGASLERAYNQIEQPDGQRSDQDIMKTASARVGDTPLLIELLRRSWLVPYAASSGLSPLVLAP